jgi:AAA family ATP:ADP antiporter
MDPSAPRRPPRRVLSFVADVRPGEGRLAVELAAAFFFLTFPAYVIKAAKEGLILDALDARHLPFAYLVTAVLIGFVVHFNIRLLDRLPRRRYISGTLVFFIACLPAFWLLFQTPGLRRPIPALGFWFWADVFVATVVTQFWIMVNDALHPHQAKRLVGLFVSGGLLGGIAGSLLTSGLARAIGTETLLLVCPVLLAPALVMVQAIYRAREKSGEGPSPSPVGPPFGYRESFRLVRDHRYLRLLAALTVAAISVTTLLGFLYQTSLKGSIADKNERTAFIGFLNLGLLTLSWALQLLVTARFLRRFGVRAALLAAPLWLGAAVLTVFVWPASAFLAWACFIRASDKVLDTSLQQTVRELLYMPLAADVKNKAKVFIDMFVNKAATGLGAVLILVVFSGLRAPLKTVALVAAVLAAAWAVLARRAYLEYYATVKKDLALHWEDGNKVVADHVDVDAARLVFDTLQSRDRSSTLYTLNVLDLVRRDKLTPEMKSLLAWKEDELRARSMDSLLDAGGDALCPGIEDALGDKEFETDIGEILSLDSYRKVMDAHFGRVLERGRGSEVERMETAKMLGLMQPTAEVARRLKQLLRDYSPEVLRYALAAAAVHRKKDDLPLLFGHLGPVATRQWAQDALAAYGERAIGALKNRLEDASADRAVRTAIPDVLARIGTQRAADILMAELDRGRRDTLSETVEALFKISAPGSGLRFPASRVRRAVFAAVSRAYAAVLNGGGPGDGRSGLETELKQVFDLLSLVYPRDDVVRAYQNLRQGTRKSMDYAVELLDNLLEPELKTYLFPLVEDLTAAERAARVRRLAVGLEKLGSG